MQEFSLFDFPFHKNIVLDTQNLSSNNHFKNNLFPWVKDHFRLWSLGDMLKITAQQYISIGVRLNEITHILDSLDDEPLIGKRLDDLKTFFSNLKEECDLVNLKISSSVLVKTIHRLSPQVRGLDTKTTRGILITLMDTINEEFKSPLFLCILPHHVVYYEWNNTFSEQLTTAFPEASRNLFHAGNCFCLEEYTACVYHSMRATEIGLRAMALYLKIPLTYPLELAEWGKLIQGIDDEITKMQKLPKTIEKDEEIIFCSHAVGLFRNWKNAYRNPSAHARAYYEEIEAKSIMERTREFLEHLGTKLSEPPL